MTTETTTEATAKAEEKVEGKEWSEWADEVADLHRFLLKSCVKRADSPGVALMALGLSMLAVHRAMGRPYAALQELIQSLEDCPLIEQPLDVAELRAEVVDE